MSLKALINWNIETYNKNASVFLPTGLHQCVYRVSEIYQNSFESKNNIIDLISMQKNCKYCYDFDSGVLCTNTVCMSVHVCMWFFCAFGGGSKSVSVPNWRQHSWVDFQRAVLQEEERTKILGAFPPLRLNWYLESHVLNVSTFQSLILFILCPWLTRKLIRVHHLRERFNLLKAPSRS